VEFDNASYGTLGLETAFGIVNQVFDLETAIALLTKGRKRYKLETPAIKEGETACLTIFDPTVEYTFNKKNIVSTSKNSLFLEKPLKGRVFGLIQGNKTML